MRIADVTHVHVQEVLEPIWLVKKETARRILQRIAEVFTWAVSKELRSTELARSVVRAGLGRQKIKKRNFPAVPIEEAPRVYQAIKALGTTAAQALQFQILTALRPAVGRGAMWSEFDFENWLWVIPAERMKMDQKFVVPLSEEACHLIKLNKAIPFAGNEDSPFVFPSPSAPMKRAISDTSCSKVLKEISPVDTMHGWRSTFYDWARENADVDPEFIDAALAHELKDEVKAAYQRTLFLDERQRLMQQWEDFLEGRTKPREGLDAAFRRKQRAAALEAAGLRDAALNPA
jgi:integrase